VLDVSTERLCKLAPSLSQIMASAATQQITTVRPSSRAGATDEAADSPEQTFLKSNFAGYRGQNTKRFVNICPDINTRAAMASPPTPAAPDRGEPPPRHSSILPQYNFDAIIPGGSPRVSDPKFLHLSTRNHSLRPVGTEKIAKHSHLEQYSPLPFLPNISGPFVCMTTTEVH
jgi:hypothetical protein